MKLNSLIFLSFVFVSFLIWWQAIFVFFVQDDFILINEFSKDDIVDDFKRAFGSPDVTHWRPLHNLYFLISGNLFGADYRYYHALSLLIFAFGAFFAFKVTAIILESKTRALLSSLLYVSSPIHFVSLNWISGNSTILGFLFLLISFYLFLRSRKVPSLAVFILSLLASEAMIVGGGLFLVWSFLNKRLKKDSYYIYALFLVGTLFIVLRFLFLTPGDTFRIYVLDLSVKLLNSGKYYASRIVGFAETGGDRLLSVVISTLVIFVTFGLASRFRLDIPKYVYFAFAAIILGLFPFILLPGNLSPHYMVLSVWGFSILVVSAFKNKVLVFGLVLAFVFVNIQSIFLTRGNNWVIDRSYISKHYIDEIKRQDLEAGSLIIFNDDYTTTSREAYFSLGTGKAFDFLFGDKNFRYCFGGFENCYELP